MKIFQTKVEEFLQKSKDYLASFFYQKNNFGLHLKDIYPVIFDNTIESKKECLELEGTIEFFYDDILPIDLRKDYGQFYTKNNNLINIIINKLDLLSGKVLEPSCGSGLFLVAIAKKIISIMRNNNNAENVLNYLLENLYGNDVDTNACQLAEINLITCVIPLIIEAINSNKEFRMKRFNITNKDFVTCGNSFKNYSIVVGNPPYVTMYGKRSRNMNEAKRMYFNTFDFVQNKKGNNKFNLSMFFIENGLKALKNNGKLIYILDISFFETAFIDLRKYLLENYHISSITSGLQEFTEVASGQLLLDVDNIKVSNKIVAWIDYESNNSVEVDQNLWINDIPKYRIIKPMNDIQERICNKLNKYQKLDFYYPSKCLRTCCALTGKTEEFIVDFETEKDHIVFPYLEGSKGLSKKFGKLTPTCHIKYDYELQLKLSNEFKVELEAQGVKNKKRVTLGDKDAYLAPKLFIRQSSTELIATYTEEPYASNNSMYILTKKSYDKKDKDMLKYICALLNSDLISFYARINKIIRIEKGKTPQIKLSDLKEIRVKIDETVYTRIIELVDELYDYPNRYETCLKEINEIIYQIYDISKEEISFIEEYLKK